MEWGQYQFWPSLQFISHSYNLRFAQLIFSNNYTCAWHKEKYTYIHRSRTKVLTYICIQWSAQLQSWFSGFFLSILIISTIDLIPRLPSAFISNKTLTRESEKKGGTQNTTFFTTQQPLDNDKPAHNKQPPYVLLSLFHSFPTPPQRRNYEVFFRLCGWSGLNTYQNFWSIKKLF